MIITIVGENDHVMKTILATNLAALRKRDGGKVLLIDADLRMCSFLWGVRRSNAGMKLAVPVLPLIDEDLYSVLQNYVPPYRDIVIVAGELDCIATKTALIAAQTAIIPVPPHHNGSQSKDALIKCMDSVRLFNPVLRILAVMTHAQESIPIQDYVTAAALAEKLPSGAVANTIIHDYPDLHRALEHGLSVFEDSPLNQAAIREMERLFQEVCGVAKISSESTCAVEALSSGLKQWFASGNMPRHH